MSTRCSLVSVGVISETVPPQTVQLLLEKGHPPAERVHTINASHCTPPSDGTDKDQITSKEEHQVKVRPEYSFVTPGEATDFSRMSCKIKMFSLSSGVSSPNCISGIRRDTAHHSLLAPIHPLFSSVVLTITRKSAVRMLQS